MFSATINIFKIPELRKKILFTIGMLCIYRVGFHVPVPGVDQEALAEITRQQGGSGNLFGQVADYLQLFTGGNLRQSSLFGLGIMPYISASIIFQLLVTVWPALEKLHKEGETGRRKIQEYTRYATVAICLIQAAFWLVYMRNSGFVYRDIIYNHWYMFFAMGVVAMTAGTIFLMWLGEQIDEYGIGNGISLIIMAGIVAQMPWAVRQVIARANFSYDNVSETSIGPDKILFLIVAFVGVVAGAILITQAQRRIPIQYAKMMRGRRVYGGQRQYLPLRVNHGGVMPIIFASTLMLFPSLVIGWISRVWESKFIAEVQSAFRYESYVYNLLYIVLIYFFAYFWTTVQFQPKEMATNLRDSGAFIPGLRPGRRTAEYLEKVMSRITYVGAGFLSIIAVVPTMVMVWLDIDWNVATFLGGTGLLIVVSVSLDLVQRIESNLIMRNYAGFMEGGRIKGAYA
ncbi:MAG: preprotein translocase subunit SecY [Sedimentisphaerales bacterium]|nr:preprotein translocase subunit SecY [Sedimentisphaerales bacterium]